ncbi:MAG: phosphate ABC transporter permease subunit PstC [Actinomycetota bacterium]|nr:phosphate ABC transporter permease subunit PstC [Actinomycetota bacterium]
MSDLSKAGTSTAEGAWLAPSAHLRRRNFFQSIAVNVMRIGTLVTALITTGIIFSLIPPTIELLGEITTQVFGTTWAPLFLPPEFGILPLITGTFVIVIIAMFIAIPFGLAAALFLSDYASFNVRRVVKPILEILAGIPTVVLGLFGLYVINPGLVEKYWPIGESVGYSAIGAGLMTGVLTLPIVASVADDALSAVPRAMREAGFALGATRREVATKIVFNAGISGVVAAVILAFARAFGETTVALMVAGSYPKLSLNPGDPMQTMASFIGFAGIGDQPTDSTGYKTIFLVGSILFLVTLVFNLLGNRIISRFREVYE